MLRSGNEIENARTGQRKKFLITGTESRGDASLKAFIKSADHAVALKQFEHDLRERTIFVRYRVLGQDLPLTWPEAIERQKARQEYVSLR
ncbi:MAG: hypothetical protein M3077_01030 [Candidatus Dormibacteraeota bacterium]|nr:hypothetical protein [Candidatus Dormibacteraeota bacterium]